MIGDIISGLVGGGWPDRHLVAAAHEGRRQHAENWPGINSRANLLKLLRSSGTYCGAVPRRTARRVSRPALRASRRVSRRSRRPARRS